MAETVLPSAPKPLLLIRPLETRESLIPPPAHPYQTIVVPLDGSELAGRALDAAQSLAAVSGATIVLLPAGSRPRVVARWQADQPTPAGSHLPSYREAARQQVDAAAVGPTACGGGTRPGPPPGP